MARRWGSTPHRLRHELTYAAFATYLGVERRALGEEAIVAAYGTAAAIAEVFGGKKTKALQKFAKGVKPQLAAETPAGARKSPGGHSMDVLRSRVKQAVANGEL